MDPHPAAVAQPRLFWNIPDQSDQTLRRNPAIYPYRPDWFAEEAASAPPGSAACAIAYAHPACALELLRKNYRAMAPTIEPALGGSGECTFQLLTWAREKGVPLYRDPKFYRKILRESGQPGAEYARRFDHGLGKEISDWSADRRHTNPAAAAWFLAHHHREAIQPYDELLRSAPAAIYWALPQLSGRGFELTAGDTRSPKWAYHLALSKFSRDNGDYLPVLRRDPVWLVDYLLVKRGRIEPVEARETAARLKDEHCEHPLLQRALTILGGPPVAAVPPVLIAGRQAESSALERLRRAKNREIYRPSDQQIESEAFKRIVGPPRYTPRGYAKGTVMDAVSDGELAEIKSGSSPLEPTYQLRLQAYRATVEKRRLLIYTDRPVSAPFVEKLTPLGVAVEPLPE